MSIRLFPSTRDEPNYTAEKRKLDKDDQSLLTLFLNVEQLGLISGGKTNLDTSIWMGQCRQVGEFQKQRAKTEVLRREMNSVR